MIALNEWSDYLTEIEEYFGKQLTDKQGTVYFHHFKNKPKEALEYIVNRLIQTRKPQKSNFPSIEEMLEIYLIWKKENPEKFINAVDKCEDCGGNGFLIFKKWDAETEVNYQYACNCGACKNKYFQMNYRVTYLKEQLESAGYQIVRNTDLTDKGQVIIQEEIPF